MPVQPASVSAGDMGKECTSGKEREREREKGNVWEGKTVQCRERAIWA